MKILFILKESVMHERIGVMYLASALKKRGFEVDALVEDNLPPKGLIDSVKSFGPDVIGYSAMTGNHLGLLEINRRLKKELDFTAVFGGPHPTFFPDIINENGLDAICIGEGDVAFCDFCEKIVEGKAFWETPNFWVKRNGSVVRNDIRPLVEDLDALSFPDRDLMYKADPPLYNEGHKTFFTMRGCPYQCTYCFNNKYNRIYNGKGSVLRYRSAENVIDEIAMVKDRYPLNVVLIDDDTFLPKPKGWIECFCSLYKERIKLPFSINMRANFVNEADISLLKDAGLDSVWIGVECGNEDIANRILNRRLTNAQIMEASRIIKKYNIKLATQNLIGLPVPDSYAVDIETLDLNIRIKPTFGWSSILYPYPGTSIESYAKEHGYLKSSAPVLNTNKRSSILNFTSSEKRKIENLHKLFGMMVRFPFLRKYTDFLCALPLDFIYVPIFYLWYGYNMKFKLYPIRSVRKELGNYMRLWWKFIRKN